MSCTVRGRIADTVRMGVCKARETATTTATTHSHDGRQEKDQRHTGNGGGAPGRGPLTRTVMGVPRILPGILYSAKD